MASGITIEVEFSSKNEVELKLVVFMMKVSRCLKKIGNETIASTHDHEAIGRGHEGRAAREEKKNFWFFFLQKWAFQESDMTQKSPENTKSLSAHQVKCQL